MSVGRSTRTTLLLALVILPATVCRRRYRACHEQPVPLREDRADVVLTGTVRRLYQAAAPLHGGEVHVKRVLKGDVSVGEALLVEGFGNPDFCSGSARVKDTRIFLLSQLPTGRFRLNSSHLHLNVPNLDRITAAVKDAPYRRRPLIQDLPCERKYCPFNGDCTTNQRGSEATCRCPPPCVGQFEPVCGSDQRTYRSECEMRTDSCQRRSQIFVRHLGEC